PRDTQPILISFYDSSNNQLANITLGKFHSPSQSSFDFPSPPIGRYLLTSSSPKVALVKETFFDISPNPADWLNKQFFQTGNLTSIQWIPADQQPAWTLSKTNDQWQLDNPPPNQTADPNKISLATSSLANPFFNDVLPQPKPDDIEGTLILKNDNNVILTLIIGKEKDGNRPISISATAPPDAQPQPNLSDFQKFSGYTYLVPSYLLQNLLIPRNDFFTTTQQSEPQPNPEPSPTPSSVTTEPLSAPTN
ncbi:MAG: DUF4340 domain-containing protein, partial [Chthoniobacterales bacterium]|nr:DUF4340 domain-containing protein [Chthoniobacterales bacterium]